MDNLKYLLGIVLILIAAAGGYFFGVSRQNSSPGSTKQVSKNPLFKSQTATFQGTITKIDGSKLSLKDDSGQAGTFSLSPKVTIYKFSGSTRQASASSDIKTLETGKQVLIVLELKDNQYQVISISYLPPPPAKR